MEIIHIPMVSRIELNLTGYPRTYTEFLKIDHPSEYSDVYAYFQLQSYLYLGLTDKLISDEYLDNDEDLNISSKINTGLYRGVFTGFNPDVSGGGAHTYPEVPFFNNMKQYYMIIDEVPPTIIPINYDFGTTSLYYNGDNNLFDEHIEPKFKAKYKSNIKTKLLYLPLFELLDLLKWKKPIHVIQQKNESFKGLIKTISFTLSNEGLSPTEIEYLQEYSE